MCCIPMIGPRAQALWNKIHLTPEPYQIEHRMRRYDGSYRWHQVRGAPVLGQDGKVLRWIGVCTDIQDLRSALAATRDANELLAVIGRSTDAIVFAKDADGKFVFANDAALQVMEADAKDVIGKSASDTANRSAEARNIASNDAFVLAQKQMLVIEERWTNRAGEERIYRSTKGPWMRSDGSVGIVGITTDVTREHELAEALADEKCRFVNLSENLPFVLWLTDADGQLIVRNNMWQSYTGLPDKDDFPLTFADIIDPAEFVDFATAWKNCIAAEGIFDTQVNLRDALQGICVPHQVIAIPVYGRHGELNGWVGSATVIN